MTELEKLVDKARNASLNERIDMRDTIARHGRDAIELVGEWLPDPGLQMFAVRVITKAAEYGAEDDAVATLMAAREETGTKFRSDVDSALRALGANPTKRRATRTRRRRVHAERPLKEILYAHAMAMDPERKGVAADALWQRLHGTETLGGRDVTAIASALNIAHDLFERVDGVATFRWREEVRAVHDPSEGALSGRRLAIVAHHHARALDAARAGLHYQALTAAVLDGGDVITGANWGGTVNAALTAAEDLFERASRGVYRWKHASAVQSAGWMMRTDRSRSAWIWQEVQSGRLRQGWGSHPERDLRLLRERKARGEAFDEDDELAWDNRRMMADEPDGIQPADLILTPHLPREWRWSVLRVTGVYRYEISSNGDYGHCLPVKVVEADVDPHDVHVDESLREAARYPARLMRMSSDQTRHLHRLLAE